MEKKNLRDTAGIRSEDSLPTSTPFSLCSTSNSVPKSISMVWSCLTSLLLFPAIFSGQKNQSSHISILPLVLKTDIIQQALFFFSILPGTHLIPHLSTFERPASLSGVLLPSQTPPPLPTSYLCLTLWYRHFFSATGQGWGGIRQTLHAKLLPCDNLKHLLSQADVQKGFIEHQITSLRTQRVHC